LPLLLPLLLLLVLLLLLSCIGCGFLRQRMDSSIGQKVTRTMASAVHWLNAACTCLWSEHDNPKM
jgi:hypothetical protein